MKLIIATIIVLSSIHFANADSHEEVAYKEVYKIIDLYSDGYSILVDNSLSIRTISFVNSGDCIILAGFTLEGKNAGNNQTQFISIFECTQTFGSIAPDKKIYLSQLYRFYSDVGPFFDFDSSRFKDGVLTLDGLKYKVSDSTASPTQKVIAELKAKNTIGWSINIILKNI